MVPSPELAAAIVVIDLVLAGDNAIVIALAARNLPKTLQRRAVIWGTVGAVAVRATLTVAVLWLLEVPGLMGAGGVLLAWIAYRLLAGDARIIEVAAATGFWGAMRTIVIADAVMGLDNVLAVAGAAHGSVLLVVAGLVISIPIVVGLDPHPQLDRALSGPALYRRRRARMDGRQDARRRAAAAGVPRRPPRPEDDAIPHADRRGPRPRSAAQSQARRAGKRPKGGNAMKILVPVDASAAALAPVAHLEALARSGVQIEVLLLNVQPRFHRHIAQFTSRRQRDLLREERSRVAMARAIEALSRTGLRFSAFTEVGTPAERIAAVAERERVDEIMMGVGRHPDWLRWINPSIAQGVMARTDPGERSRPRPDQRARALRRARRRGRPRRSSARRRMTMRILVPDIDAVNSLPAVRCLVRRFVGGERFEVHLVYVRAAIDPAAGDRPCGLLARCSRASTCPTCSPLAAGDQVRPFVTWHACRVRTAS